MHPLSESDRREIAELLSVAQYAEDCRDEVAQDIWLRHQLTIEEAVRMLETER